MDKGTSFLRPTDTVGKNLCLLSTLCGKGTFVSVRPMHRWQMKFFPDDSSGKVLVSNCNFEILSLLWKQRSVSILNCFKV